MTAAGEAGPVLLERPPVDWERHRGDKRPKILPPPGVTWRNPSTGRKVGHRYYTRVTTYADAITEAYNLTAWKLRRVALGLGQRADYVRLAASYTDEDRDRDALDELVGKALEAAGPNKADLGTALHSLTERLDRGEDLGTPPEEVLPDLAAYTAITSGVLGIRWREPRTVCDLLECAGTPDTIATVSEAPPTGEGLPVCDCPPDRLRVVDTKTGSVRYPGKMSTQLSIYSRSELYDPETGARTPLDVCPHWGVIVHLPVETGEAALFWLDLEHGWRGAELCGPVRSWHRVKADDILRPFATIKPVKVVDGEVTRIEPRLASVNITAPTPLEPLADVTEQLAASLAERGVPVAGLEVESERDDQGDEAALHEDLSECDVRVVGTNEDGSPMHWCADHDSAWPHKTAEAPAKIEWHTFAPPMPGMSADPSKCVRCGLTDLDPASRHDRCAHSGSRFIGPGGLTCRDCGEVLNATTHRTPPATAEDDTDEPDAGPVEIDTDELASGPDSDAEDEPALEPEVERQLDEVLAEEVEAEAERLSWPGVDEVDPLAEEIRRCITTRDLELLGTAKWREWTQAHRDLATETHDRLKAEEEAAKPRAATEAAINAAETPDALAAVMAEIGGAEWMTDELFALADARWRHLKGTRPVNA